jgi:hypothetical protein
MPPHIRPQETVDSALWLSDLGFLDRQNAQIHGVAVKTIRRWRRLYQRQGIPRGGATASTGSRCPRCHGAALDERAYAHLLGWYLGDGCLSKARRDVFVLAIVNDARYPHLAAEVMASMAACKSRGRARQRSHPGATVIELSWKHWPCLFPQHGQGRKHSRPIVLEQWQVEIVERHPDRFLRGLFHSDGCRSINSVVRQVAGKSKRYEYPRYFFKNTSDDIRGLACWALDLCGVAWRRSNRLTISVARREGVDALDRMVGPKH